MATSSHVQKSTELYDRAGELIPGWTQLISRRATGYAQGVSPVYATSAKGARFTDVDGNEYLDWVVCFTAVVLGYADEVVDGAVLREVDTSDHYPVWVEMRVE